MCVCDVLGFGRYYDTAARAVVHALYVTRYVLLFLSLFDSISLGLYRAGRVELPENFRRNFPEK